MVNLTSRNHCEIAKIETSGAYMTLCARVQSVLLLAVISVSQHESSGVFVSLFAQEEEVRKGHVSSTIWKQRLTRFNNSSLWFENNLVETLDFPSGFQIYLSFLVFGNSSG